MLISDVKVKKWKWTSTNESDKEMHIIISGKYRVWWFPFLKKTGLWELIGHDTTWYYCPSGNLVNPSLSQWLKNEYDKLKWEA